jgi:hypothetical protein
VLIQYESASVITGDIKGTSARLLRNELALEELSMRRQFHKLALFYKIGNMLTPIYLTELLLRMQREISQFSLRSVGNFSLLRCRTVRYYESFFPSTIKLWNVQSLDIRNSQSILIFKAKLRSHFSPSEYNKLFNNSVTRRLSVLYTRLRLGHCALNDYLFKINCKTSPICSCGIDNESVMHYLLHCPLFVAQSASLLASALQTCSACWMRSNDKKIVEIFLNGISGFDCVCNRSIFPEVQNFILNTGRFSVLQN